MQDFDIMATHSCGHTQRHTGETTTSIQEMLDIYSTHKCRTCRPTCGFCGRSGDRENMLIMPDDAAFCNEWCHLQSQHPTHYREHSAIEIPVFIRHWSDVSYHNDACARSEYAIGRHTFTIWVEREDPADRENPARFVVEFCPYQEFSGEDTNHLYTGDDASQVAQWAHAAEIVVSGPDPDDDIDSTDKAQRIRALITEMETN